MMGKMLYLECASGVSGDMVVAALLDAGVDEQGLREALDSLGVGGFEIAVSRKKVSGIDVCDFDVVLDEAHESHDHDMAYLYGDLDGEKCHSHGHHGHGHHHHDHEHEHGHHHHRHHDHDHDHEHGHDHEHEHSHHHHHDHDHDHEHGHDQEHEHDHGGYDHEHSHGHNHEHGHHSHEHHDHDHHHDHGHHHHHHDHDHEYSHDHDHEHGYDHSHEHVREHHRHDHGHGHHHHHEHRGLAEITAIIDGSTLSERAKVTAHRIFAIVAEAESKAHGIPVEEVHFHEVGAIDSIVDVVAAAYCLDALDITEAYVSPLAEGHGRVRCAHGVLSVPVPAVMHIAEANGLVLQRRDIEGELVTPTGAAIAAAIRTADALPDAYRVLASGTGAGKRDYNPPSTVHALVVEPVAAGNGAPAPSDASLTTCGVGPTASDGSPASIDATLNACDAGTAVASNAGMQADVLGKPDFWKLETEMDDCTGEALGHVTQLLYDAGALEVHYLPVFMKKNRPGYQIEVLCGESNIAALEGIIFENTTTIGIRRCPEWRTALQREAAEIETPLGTVQVKVVTLPSGTKRTYPEYESVAQLARKTGQSYQDTLATVMKSLK